MQQCKAARTIAQSRTTHRDRPPWRTPVSHKPSWIGLGIVIGLTGLAGLLIAQDTDSSKLRIAGQTVTLDREMYRLIVFTDVQTLGLIFSDRADELPDLAVSAQQVRSVTVRGEFLVAETDEGQVSINLSRITHAFFYEHEIRITLG
jgi:hypothetical protein